MCTAEKSTVLATKRPYKESSRSGEVQGEDEKKESSKTFKQPENGFYHLYPSPLNNFSNVCF